MDGQIDYRRLRIDYRKLRRRSVSFQTYLLEREEDNLRREAGQMCRKLKLRRVNRDRHRV
jgi:hypothetical protein